MMQYCMPCSFLFITEYAAQTVTRSCMSGTGITLQHGMMHTQMQAHATWYDIVFAGFPCEPDCTCTILIVCTSSCQVYPGLSGSTLTAHSVDCRLSSSKWTWCSIFKTGI